MSTDTFQTAGPQAARQIAGQQTTRSTGRRPVSVIVPLLLVGFGAYLLWFAVKYWRGTGPAVWPSYPLKSVLQGHGLPAPQPAAPASSEVTAYEQQIGSSTGGGGTGTTGSAIAGDALRYSGAPYKWGGAQPSGWDCSGFVNWVVGHDLGQPIPGAAGGFGGQAHGPDVALWIAWPQAPHVASPQAGDLACWGPNAHMGVCISPTEMISALNPALGTRVTTIAAAHVGIPVYKRIAAAGGGGGGSAQNTARLLLSRYGWDTGQMPPLIQLWNRESNWSPVARNPGSGALGIPQALGHGTSGTGGSLGNEYGPVDGDWYGMTPADMQAANSGRTVPQIRWGFGYIRQRYGSPAAAWRFWQVNGWY